MSIPQRDSFLPDLCGLRALFLVVSVAQLLAFMLSVTRTGFGPLAWSELALLSLYVQWIAMSAAAVLCLARRHFPGSDLPCLRSTQREESICP